MGEMGEEEGGGYVFQQLIKKKKTSVDFAAQFSNNATKDRYICC